MKSPYDIIQAACLTEKALRIGDKYNRYVFRVVPSATKSDIKAAVQAVFKKRVIKVNTLNVGGKERRKRTAARGFTSDWKKAIVQLAEGEKLDFT